MLKLDWSIIYTIVNLLILFVLLRKFLFRPVMKVIEERQAMIEHNMTNAQEKEAESARLLQTAQQQVSGAAQEAERVAEERMAQVRRDQEKLLLEAKNESDRILVNGRKQAELERQQLLNQARAEVVGVAIEAARKIAGSNPEPEQVGGLFLDLLDKVGDGDE